MRFQLRKKKKEKETHSKNDTVGFTWNIVYFARAYNGGVKVV